MIEDLGKEPMPLGENNIAYRNAANRRARGVVLLDEDGLQSGTDDNPQPVTLKGMIDAANSTAIILNAAAAFTGIATDILDFGFIFVTVFSDVASATDGFSVQQSADGTNWDNTDEFSIPAGTGKTYSFQPAAKWFRVVYTNGGTNQGVFRLQTVLKKTSSLPSSHRISNNLSPEDDASLVVAVIKGQNPTGSYVDFDATTAGNFKMSLEEFDAAFVNNPLPVRDATLSISRGVVTGISPANKFGRAQAGIQVTVSDIWDRADSAATQQVWIAPTQARVHDISSSSTADDGTPEGAGAGAQAVEISGLTTWDTAETKETVILNGVGSVATVNSYVIIHRMKILPVGTTYNLNLGTIIATAQTDSTVTAQINIGNGQTEMAIYGIPSTQKAYITEFDVNAHNTGNPSTVIETDFDLVVNEYPNLNETVFIIKANVGMISTGSSSFSKTYNPYLEIAGPAIIKFQAIATLADTEGVAEYDLILVDN